MTRPRIYYNEVDPYAAQWLRHLIMFDYIAPGDVDERSIEDVKPEDLQGYTQCHFFAGIGVWSHALRLAGWPDDRPVWTGSCPCQPFSAAGKRGGTADERHLWPHWFHLIAHAKPRDVPVFGEQVASKDGLAWLDLVHADLEGQGYAVGAIDLCAAGVGAPHIRQRSFFVADAEHSGPQGRVRGGPNEGRENQHGHAGRDGATNHFWRAADWLPCTDGKSRPVEPGTFPLAHGAAARVGRLRAYGNAICAPQAAAFIQAFMEVR